MFVMRNASLTFKYFKLQIFQILVFLHCLDVHIETTANAVHPSGFVMLYHDGSHFVRMRNQ